MKTQIFEVSYREHLLIGDKHSGVSNTLVLHGAGKSSRAMFLRFREALYEKGISTVSFDFIGHGDTGGQLAGSSLRERTEQGAAVIRKHCRTPLSIIGASMSGYTAIKLTELFPVDNLILFVPAVYTIRAYDVAFGDTFSEVIRSPGSWKDSDAFRILSAFNGNLIIFAAESDEVIPREVTLQIFDAAKQANKEFCIIPDSSHRSLFPTQKDFLATIAQILKMCEMPL